MEQRTGVKHSSRIKNVLIALLILSTVVFTYIIRKYSDNYILLLYSLMVFVAIFIVVGVIAVIRKRLVGTPHFGGMFLPVGYIWEGEIAVGFGWALIVIGVIMLCSLLFIRFFFY